MLKANGGGALVQLNSVGSMKSFPDFATYTASKAASYSITQALREILQAQGTRVVSVHPGPIATDMCNSAGLGEIAEPPELVPQAIIAALGSGEFHAFPDTMAKQVGAAYRDFATNRVSNRTMLIDVHAMPVLKELVAYLVIERLYKARFSAPGYYRIEVQGQLGPYWPDRFGGMRVLRSSSDEGNAVTVMEGRVSDQAKLAGILNTLYELHLPLLSVQYLDEAGYE